MIRERSFGMQALALVLGSGAAQILLAALYIVTARNMQPDEFGPVATAIALGVAGAGFVDLGASPYWIRELASGRATQEQLSPRMVTRLLIASAVAGAVITVAALTERHYIATGVILLSTSLVLTLLVPLRAARRAQLVGWLTVLDRTVASIFFFGQTALGVELGLALWTSMAVGDLCLVMYVVIFERIQIMSNVFKFSNPWAGAKWYSLSTLSASAYQLDLPIVAVSAGASAAGIYGGVNRWVQPMALAVSGFGAAAAPFLAAEGDLRDQRRQILRASWLLAAAMTLSSGVIFAAPTLVTVLLGDSYASSAAVLQWLAGGMILNAIALPLIVGLQSRRLDHLAAIITVVTVGIQLMVVAALAPTLGALAAGIGFFTCQALQFTGASICIAAVVWRRRHLSRGQQAAR